MLPTHTLHELFANHEDTEHDFCAKYHAHLGTHVEKKHTHCEILKTTAPVYNSPQLLIFEKTAPVFTAEIKSTYPSTYFNFHFRNVPARGPPAA